MNRIINEVNTTHKIMPKQIDITEQLKQVQESGEFGERGTVDILGYLYEHLGLEKLLIQIKNSIGKFLDDLFSWLSFASPPGENVDPDWLMQVVQYTSIVIGIIVLGLILWVVFKFIKSYRGTQRRIKQESIQATTLVQMPYSQWVTEAIAFANNHEYRNACRYLYLASIYYLDEKSILEYDKSKTNFEYLSTVSKDKELYNHLKKLVTKFEYLWYGEHPGDQADFTNCMETYKALTTL